MCKIIFLVFGLSTVVSASVIPDVVVQYGLNEPGTRFADLPRPQDFIYELNEFQLEDYTSYWRSIQQKEENKKLTVDSRLLGDFGCKVNVSFQEPTPVFERAGQLIRPYGRTINFEDNEKVTAICAGSGNVLIHKQSGEPGPQTAVLACQKDDYFTSNWLSTAVRLPQVVCSYHPLPVETKTTSCSSGGTLIQVGVQGTRAWNIFSSCFHEEKAQVFYTQHALSPENQVTSGAKRPGIFSQGNFFPGLSVNDLYKMEFQKKTFATILGSADMVPNYISRKRFLTRGHLTPKGDFSFNYEQRATFTFINVAPQWASFNQGNWQKLEQKLKMRITNGKLYTQIYTGTWGLMTLNDHLGVPTPFYLSPSDKKIPIPLWFYKVVRDISNNKSTAFIGTNNPYLTISEAKSLAFCTDECADNKDFSWLPWKNDDPKFGYSFCCDVNEFRKVIDILPEFPVSGLFY